MGQTSGNCETVLRHVQARQIPNADVSAARLNVKSRAPRAPHFKKERSAPKMWGELNSKLLRPRNRCFLEESRSQGLSDFGVSRLGLAEQLLVHQSESWRYRI